VAKAKAEAELQQKIDAAIAEGCCTFSKTGSTYVKHAFFECITCGFTKGKGFCQVCKEKCHSGHDVREKGIQLFYCDCGSAGADKCRTFGRIESGGGERKDNRSVDELIAEHLRSNKKFEDADFPQGSSLYRDPKKPTADKAKNWSKFQWKRPEEMLPGKVSCVRYMTRDELK
jgi:hypothetical protein